MITVFTQLDDHDHARFDANCPARWGVKRVGRFACAYRRWPHTGHNGHDQALAHIWFAP
jgi:hypothetical protein